MTNKKPQQQKVKGVSFNLSNKTDKDMFEYALLQGNFSSYVKNLIFMDMRLRNWSQMVNQKNKDDQ